MEETLSDNTLKSAIHRKLEEFEDGAKVGQIRTKSVGVVDGHLFMFTALRSQGGSSHRDLPMNRTFTNGITNNNHDFVSKMAVRIVDDSWIKKLKWSQQSNRIDCQQ